MQVFCCHLVAIISQPILLATFFLIQQCLYAAPYFRTLLKCKLRQWLSKINSCMEHFRRCRETTGQASKIKQPIQEAGFFWVLTFAEQLLEGSPSQGASNLQPFWDNCRCDELVVGHFFAQFVISGLVKQDKVVQLVSHFPLGPLLLEKREKTTPP